MYVALCKERELKSDFYERWTVDWWDIGVLPGCPWRACCPLCAFQDTRHSSFHESVTIHDQFCNCIVNSSSYLHVDVLH